jgi:hypothetical protein
MKCAQTLEVGAYVLGALVPAERDAFERHLGECSICREEVAELAVLPGLLGRIDAATAMAVARDGEEHSILPSNLLADVSDDDPSAWAGPTAVAGWAGPTAEAEEAAAEEPEKEKDKVRWAGPTVVASSEDAPSEPADSSNVISLLDAAARRRAREKRRRRFGTVAAALVAACLALAVGLGLPPLLSNGSATPDLTAMQEVAGVTVPVTAKVALSGTTSGARVIMQCTYKENAASDRRWEFQLVAVLNSGGEPQVLSGWSAVRGDEFEIQTETSFKPDQIDRLEIRFADGRTLLTFDV